MLFYTTMDVYKIYTNTVNNVARGITKILIISCFADSHTTHIVDSSAETIGRRFFALGWLIPGTNCSENRERFLHMVAQETINLNVALVYLNLMRHRILCASWFWRRYLVGKGAHYICVNTVCPIRGVRCW